MAFWRQTLTVMTCALLIGVVAGCTPASNSPFDEEKDPHVVQGRNRETAYNYSGAIESYHRALEVNPQNSVAHHQLGLLYEREDRDPAAAIYHFQRYLKLRPNSERAAVIRQHILGCKQELAKEVSLGLVSGEMKNQLDALVQKNQLLTEENRRISEESQRLKEQLARTQPGPVVRGTTSARPPGSTTQPERPVTRPPTTARSTHTVQKGDTYYSIAKSHGISTASLEAANPGVNPTRLRIGQRLVVPARR